MDNLTPEQRSRAMSRIKRRDTRPEIMLRRALWAAGSRGYRIDDRRLPGRPDLAWTGGRVAVFVDGKFWHGHPSAYKPGRHGDYWDEKIRRNIERDRAADAALASMGWTVLRFWDFQVRRDLNGTTAKVIEALQIHASGSSASA
ncbi:MAG TPA: very short patch repair endonuclease [Gaiellaceae bacterium]|nr:very short patch repair endonuclease [Gaiellaceae bacterium]